MNYPTTLIFSCLFLCFQTGCGQQLENKEGATVYERFTMPEGYTRKEVDKQSFASYLRNLPLKPSGSPVKYYNGQTKLLPVYDAVVDMEIGTRDLQQCADAIIRLRGEYLYAQKRYDEISFDFTNGFAAEYKKWKQGQRIVVNGNKVSWKESATAPSNSYPTFRKYLDMVFAYAGTLSLSKSLSLLSPSDLNIGDVFIQGGSPGHAVIVVDVAQNKKGDKIFLLAQSYMPAQDIQILKNPTNKSLSPWYELKTEGNLVTPEWVFKWNSDLKKF